MTRKSPTPGPESRVRKDDRHGLESVNCIGIADESEKDVLRPSDMFQKFEKDFSYFFTLTHLQKYRESFHLTS